MSESIGEAAGKVWRHLNGNGPVPISSVVKATELRRREVDRAIGWLAKEGKVDIETHGKQELMSLSAR